VSEITPQQIKEVVDEVAILNTHAASMTTGNTYSLKKEYLSQFNCYTSLYNSDDFESATRNFISQCQSTQTQLGFPSTATPLFQMSPIFKPLALIVTCEATSSLINLIMSYAVHGSTSELLIVDESSKINLVTEKMLSACLYLLTVGVSDAKNEMMSDEAKQSWIQFLTANCDRSTFSSLCKLTTEWRTIQGNEDKCKLDTSLQQVTIHYILRELLNLNSSSELAKTMQQQYSPLSPRSAMGLESSTLLSAKRSRQARAALLRQRILERFEKMQQAFAEKHSAELEAINKRLSTSVSRRLSSHLAMQSATRSATQSPSLRSSSLSYADFEPKLANDEHLCIICQSESSSPLGRLAFINRYTLDAEVIQRHPYLRCRNKKGREQSRCSDT